MSVQVHSLEALLLKLTRLTLRDLFWLVLVVAMSIGWLLHQIEWSNALEQEKELTRNQQHLVRSLAQELADLGYTFATQDDRIVISAPEELWDHVEGKTSTMISVPPDEFTGAFLKR